MGYVRSSSYHHVCAVLARGSGKCYGAHQSCPCTGSPVMPNYLFRILLASYTMFTMLVRVLSINTKHRKCCFFQILSGECCETELFLTSDASKAPSIVAASVLEWPAWTLEYILFHKQINGDLHTVIHLKLFQLKTQSSNILMVYVL